MVPEKQGLKLEHAIKLDRERKRLSSGSRKTRIETTKYLIKEKLESSLSSGSRKTRIETDSESG